VLVGPELERRGRLGGQSRLGSPTGGFYDRRPTHAQVARFRLVTKDPARGKLPIIAAGEFDDDTWP
jgi:hypothetical protein